MKLPTVAQAGLRPVWLAVIAIITLTSLSSCDEEEDPYYYDGVVGTWQQVAPAVLSGDVYTFYNNGYGFYQGYDGDSDFSWWYSDGYLVLNFGSGYPNEYYSYEFQGGSLYMYPTDSYDTWVLNPY